MSLLAGGVANAVYASDNADAYDEIEPVCDQRGISSQLEDFCDDVKRLIDSEIAASVSYCSHGTQDHCTTIELSCYTLTIHEYACI